MNLELKSIMHMKKKEDVLNHIEAEKSVPDWVLCDLNLSEKGAGMEVAREILHRRYPTDILLYSNAQVLGDDSKIDKGRYGNIMTANRDQIGASIYRLVWRAAVKLPDPEYLRGLVLSRVTDTELLIDDCLATLFKISDELVDRFKWGLLRSDGYGPSFKYSVIERYLKDRLNDDFSTCPIKMDKKREHLTIYNHLMGVIGTRNLVAHGLAESDEAGGLFIKNRLQEQGNSLLTRDQIKRRLHLCYRTDEELKTLLEFIKNMK